jgi:hypothetical protein
VKVSDGKSQTTQEELRALLPPGVVRLARDPNDVPEIEEVWV